MNLLHCAVALGAIASSGCLPADTRPEPGHVSVSMARDPELGIGPAQFQTTDGWTVAIDTLTVGTNGVEVDGDLCNEYSGANYSRLFNMNQAGSQKLGDSFGLNACTVSFGLSRPPEDPVLGGDVSQAEGELMRRGSLRVSTPNGPSDVVGMALHIAGQMTKDEVTIHFDWGFSDRIAFRNCKRRVAGQLESDLALRSGQFIPIEIIVDPRNLFRINQDPKQIAGGAVDTAAISDSASDAASDAASPVSGSVGISTASIPALSLAQWIADADQLADEPNGQVSVDELAVPLDQHIPGGIPGLPPAAPLSEIMRRLTHPSVFRYADNGYCQIDIGSGRHDMD